MEQDVLAKECWGRVISVPSSVITLSDGRKSLYALRFSFPSGTKQFLQESYRKLRKMPAASQAQMKSLFCLRSRICQPVLGFTETYHSDFDAHSPAGMMRKDSEKLQEVVLSEALGRGALGSTWPGDLHRSCITNMGLCSPRGCEVTVLESHSIIPFTSSALSQGYACLSEILFICFQVLAMTNDTALNIV